MAQIYLKHAGLDRLTVVVAPTAGNKVLIDGKAMAVGGPSTSPAKPLPSSTGMWVMGMGDDEYTKLYAGHDGCAVIGPKASSVQVVLYDKVEGHIVLRQETWTVQHGLPNHAEAVVLKRANGDYVIAAQ